MVPPPSASTQPPPPSSQGRTAPGARRLILVDDSRSTRRFLRERLAEHGYEIEEFSDGATAAERALASPPDVVVTDLLMPGMSGVQLCRLLQSAPSTADVPVILLTSAGDRKSRFWARSAGAVAYVSKSEIDDLVEVLRKVTSSSSRVRPPPDAPSAGPRGLVQERLSQLLDGALFDAVITGEVRALASADDPAQFFTKLVGFLSEVLAYRWVALATTSEGMPLLMHAHAGREVQAEAEARKALRTGLDRPVFLIADDRGSIADGPSPLLVPIRSGEQQLGELAFAPTERGLSRDDSRIATMVAQELAGPLRVATLVEQTRRLAQTDALTGLPNRRAFLDDLGRERSRAARHALPMSVLLLDVDHFKAINDKWGHAGGDTVLQGVAAALLEVLRKSDFVARWGGEEFVLALPQTTEPGARVAAERVRRGVADAAHAMPGGHEIHVTASIGVASVDSTPWDLDEIISRADQCMYAAKARGRNRVEVWRPAAPAEVKPGSA